MTSPPPSPTPSPSSSSTSVGDMRCIAHLDMDCFYAQVEAVRLGIDCRTTPFVCVQWGSFIAVNYPARAMGVRRFRQTPGEVKREHPELQMGHIATYEMGQLEYGYPDTPRINTHKVSLEPYRQASRQIFAILRSEPGVQVGKAGIDEAYIDVTEAAEKELAGLRAASRDGGASLDALADVMEPSTRLIADRRDEMAAWFAQRGTSLAAVFDDPVRALLRGAAGGAVEGSRGFCADAADATYAARCRLLCAASRVVHRLRQRIYAELHYDCSAGIAHNRVLAKCISATHKPNQQTLLLPDRTASALFDLPLSEIRGFGGKFGSAVSAVCGGATECRELWLVPLPQLYALDNFTFGAEDEDGNAGGAEDDDGENSRGGGAGGGGRRSAHTRKAESASASTGSGSKTPSSSADKATTKNDHAVAEYVYYRIRGVHGDRVADPALPRAMEASKIFHPSCTSWWSARRWMAPLAGELWHRFRHYEDCYVKEGRSLCVYVRTYVDPDDARFRGLRSQSYRRHVALPSRITGAAMLAEAGLRELEKLMREVTRTDMKAPPLVFDTATSVTTTTTTKSESATVTAAALTAENAGEIKPEVEQTEEREGSVMPPLRIIGLSIIGLRLRAGPDGDDVADSAVAGPPQRSLKDMFAMLSATHTSTTTATKATTTTTTKTCSKTEETTTTPLPPQRQETSSNGNPIKHRRRRREGEGGEDASGEEEEEQEGIEGRKRSRSARRETSSTSEVEVIDDDNNDDDESVGGISDIDAEHRKVDPTFSNRGRGRRRGSTSPPTAQQLRPAAPPPSSSLPSSTPSRKTLEDFFQRASQQPTAPRSTGATVSGGQETKKTSATNARAAEEKRSNIVEESPYKSEHTAHQLHRSSSVIEISSDDDDHGGAIK